MKRDMDLVRRIVLATAELPPGELLVELDGVDPEDFLAHVVWMQEGGLVVATGTQFFGDEAPVARVQRLTWEGCEFADAVQSDTVWKRVKDKLIKPSASFTFALVKELLVAEARKGLPTLWG
jgi:hypothetical protein